MKELLIPYNSIENGNRIVIFGKGTIGIYYLSMIKYNRRVDVVAFIDNKAVDGEMIEGIPVISPQCLNLVSYDYILLATRSIEVAESMNADLKKQGIDSNQILYNGPISYKKYRYDSFFFRAWKQENGRCYIFMLPEHGGTGDYALGYAEQRFLRNYFPNKSVIGITSEEWLSIKEEIMNIVSPKDIIFLNGGGYIGDLWDASTTTDIYRDIVNTFDANIKFFFPNTLTYRSEVSVDNHVLQKDFEWFRNHERVHIFFRDSNSFNIARSLFENCYCFPDMVLYEHFPRQTDCDQDKVLLCFRTDIEKTFRKEQDLKEVLDHANIRHDQMDLDMNKSISQLDGINLVNHIVSIFQQYRCVITDRLHGMILSTVADVPCIAYDNLTKKVSGVYEWIRSEAVLMADEDKVDDIVYLINKVTEKKSKIGEYKGKRECFDKMARLINRIIIEEDEKHAK